MITSTLWKPRVLGAAILVALGTATLAAPAYAASPHNGPLPVAGSTADLHIVKSEAPSGAAGDGTQLGTTPPNPIAGVTFTVRQVQSIDLTTQIGWDDASALAASYNSAAPTSPAAAEQAITSAASTGGPFSLGAAAQQTTNAAGVANFTGLPLGLYLVEETGVPSATGQAVTPSAPFLVTLPMTDPNSENTWNYDVYVYPKNSATTLTKTVADATATGLGAPVVFTVTGSIPAGTSPSDEVTQYKLTDQLDPKLDYASSTLSLVGSSTALANGTDYQIIPGSATADGPLLTAEFTAAGLAKLTDAAGAQIVWTITATANASGDISNTAQLYLNTSSSNGTNTTVTSPTVDTKWGGITVKKSGTSGTALAGATFQVYATDSAGTKPAVGSDTPLTIDGIDSWTTGSDGTVKIDGLRFSGYADGGAVSDGDAGYNYYWLVETAAPAGYELQAEPIGFTVDNTDATAETTTVTDAPHNAGFTLPFTGGTGGRGLDLAGFGLLTAALLAGAVVATRRRGRRIGR